MNQVTTLQKIKYDRHAATLVLQDSIKRAVEGLPEDIAEMTELELERYFNRTPKDFALRKRLWEMVSTANVTSSNIMTTHLIDGIVQEAYFYNKLLKNPYRVAWIFTPLESFHEMYEETFHVLFNKVRDYAKKNEINEKNFNEFAKLMQDFSNRVLGPVPKNINLRAQAIPPPPSSHASPEDIDTRLKALEDSKEQELLSATVIDLEAE